MQPRAVEGVQLRPREKLGGFLSGSSRPVVDVVTLMSFSPTEIPVHEVECSHSASHKKKEGVNITVCFQLKSLIPKFQGQCCPPALKSSCPPQIPATASGSSTVQLLPFFTLPGHLVANLTYTLQLDGHRTRSRGLFPGGKPELTGNTVVTLVRSCTEFWFHFPVRKPVLVFWKGTDEPTVGRGCGLSSAVVQLGDKLC